jgi:hypothetical protein
MRRFFNTQQEEVMKHARRLEEQRRRIRRRTLHAAIGNVKDQAALAESVDIDAADDKTWFLLHPTADTRVRPMSPRERQASGCSANAEVLVLRQPGGVQIRIFVERDGDQPGGDSLPLPPPPHAPRTKVLNTWPGRGRAG